MTLCCPDDPEHINECLSAPCPEAGTCVDGVNGYICVCAEGYTGVGCQTGTSSQSHTSAVLYRLRM